jgi:hypothetical protein
MSTSLHSSDWSALRRWLRTSDADWFLDDAVLGAVELATAQEILVDYGVEPCPESYRQLGREINAALAEGC